MSDIEVRHLSKSFDLKGVKVEALKDINLSIKPGDIYGIIGMSGAGKSTLVRCLNFLERPTEGEVLVGGKDLSTLTEKELRKQRQEIAMIFQHFNLLMQKNVIDNICFPLLLRGEKKADARRRAMELLKLVDLEEKANAIRLSYQAVRNNAWPSPEPLHLIRRSFFVMRLQVPWILRPQPQFWHF